MTPLAQIVEWGDMIQTVVFSIVAGIGVTLIFSVAIWGAARYTDLSAEERQGPALAAAATSALALLAVLAAIVLGVVVMTNK